MGIYSPEVVEILKQSPYRENVSDHVIQYGDAFKQEFYCLSQQGHKPKDIFLSLGLDPALLGSNVIRSFVRSMKDFQPKLNQAGQPISITRSLIEKDEEIEKLKFEVKFLKKKEAHRLGNVSEREAKRHYFRLIQETFESPTNTWTIEAFCRFCGVSKSGYYRWKKMTQVNIEKREREDQVAFSFILEAFNYRQKPK